MQKKILLPPEAIDAVSAGASSLGKVNHLFLKIWLPMEKYVEIAGNLPEGVDSPRLLIELEILPDPSLIGLGGILELAVPEPGFADKLLDDPTSEILFY